MSTPASFTVTPPTSAVAITFDDKAVTGDKTEWFAPSPNDDLAGRLPFRLANETTKSGIERSLASTGKPQLSATTGTYDREIRCNVTLMRSQLEDLDDVRNVLETMGQALLNSDVQDALINAANA